MNMLLDQKLIAPTGKAESKSTAGTKVRSRKQRLHSGKNLPFSGLLPLPPSPLPGRATSALSAPDRMNTQAHLQPANPC